MYYQVEGYEGSEPKGFERSYGATQHAQARAFAKHLVDKCGCDSARVLHVDRAETFLREPTAAEG